MEIELIRKIATFLVAKKEHLMVFPRKSDYFVFQHCSKIHPRPGTKSDHALARQFRQRVGPEPVGV